MKKTILVCLLALCVCCLFASDDSMESTLDKLKETEVGKVLTSQRLVDFYEQTAARITEVFVSIDFPQVNHNALLIIYGVLALGGLVFIFFGGSLFKALLFLIGFIVGSLFGLEAFSDLPNTWYFILSGVLGLVIGLLVNWIHYVGIFLIGAFATTLAVIAFGYGETLYLIIAIVVGGGIALLLRKLIIALSTSFFGSVVLVSSVNNAFTLLKDNTSSSVEIDQIIASLKVDTSNLIIVVLIIAFGLAGVVFQLKTKKSKE